MEVDRIELARECWTFAEYNEWAAGNPNARFPQREAIALFRRMAKVIGNEPPPRVWFKRAWLFLMRRMGKRIRNQRRAYRQLERGWLRKLHEHERELGAANRQAEHYSKECARLRELLGDLFTMADDGDLDSVAAHTRPYAIGQGLIDSGQQPNQVWHGDPP